METATPDLSQFRGLSFADLDKLSSVERNVRSFLETYMLDNDGLVYSHLNAVTLRPWTAEQIRRKRFQLGFYNVERGDAAGQLAYEDSLMATGEYALGLTTKFEATGDARDLAAAFLPMSALLRVLSEGEKHERGFLPKPHGGMGKAAFSHEISVDQYLKTIVALRAFQRHGGAALRAHIDRCIVNMAHYHLVRDFTHPRRESMIITPENRTHGIALFIPAMFLAHKISGEKRYRTALGRFDAILNSLLRDEAPVNSNIVGLFMEGFHLAIGEGLGDERLPRLLRKLWLARVAASARRGPDYDDPSEKFKSAGVIRIASFAPIVDRHFPGTGAYKMAIVLLRRWNDPRAMRYAVGNAPLPPGRGYLKQSIREVGVTSWLVAYWRLMQQRAS